MPHLQVPAILWILVVALHLHRAAGESNNYYEGGTGCIFEQQEIKCGGANYGITGIFGSTNTPCIFTCDVQDGAAKYLKITANKETGFSPISGRDTMNLYVDSGYMCKETEVLEIDKFSSESKVGEINEDKKSFIAQNIRVTDLISHPEDAKVCFIVYCTREQLACDLTVTVEFSEQWSRPVPIPSIAFGMGWGDCITLVLFMFEMIGVCTLCCGFFFRYASMYSKLYGGGGGGGGKDKDDEEEEGGNFFSKMLNKFRK